MIYFEEDRDVATIDIPNWFIKTPIDRKPGEENITMKIEGVLVDMLVQLDSDKYCLALVYEKRKKALNIKVLKAIYGII